MRKFRRITSNLVLDHNIIYANNKQHVKDNFLKRLMRFFEQINWIHANPSKFDNLNKLDRREQLVNRFFQTTQNRILLKKLKDAILDPTIPHIYIFGKRGSGKTFFQNYFLNICTRKLNKAHYTWIRVDYTKIYHKNALVASKQHEISFFEYIWAQVVYVYIRYRQERTVKVRDKDINYSSDSVFSSLDSNNIFKKKDGSLMSKEDINTYIEDILNTPNESDSLRGKPFKYIYTETIAKNILKEIKNKNKHIILLIDGIDNVDFLMLDREYISSQLDKLYTENTEKRYFDKLILSARSELDISVEPYIRCIRPAMYIDKHNIAIENLPLDEYLLWLVTIIRQNKKEIFGVDFSENRLSEFENYIINIPSIVENELQKIIGDVPSSFHFLNDFYDGDVREMKDGLLSSYLYIYEYINNFNDNHNYNITYKNVLDNKRYVILEALFKNGMRYAPDLRIKKLAPPYRNLGFTNIFNPTEIAKNINIPPLVFVYILHYLKDQNNATIQSLKNAFKQNINKVHFEAIQGYLRDSFEHLLEYNYVIYGSNCDEGEYSKDNKQDIEITMKGKIVYEVLFRNIDVLHANIYYAPVFEDLDLNFPAYDPNGRKYIIRTLENVSKYIYFLEDLQNSLLKQKEGKEIEDNDFYINFYTREIKKSFRALFLIDGKIMKIDEEIKGVVKKLSGNIIKCTEDIKQFSYKQAIDKINQVISLSDQERIQISLELISLKINSFDINLCINMIEDSRYFSDYLNYDKNREKIQKLIKEYIVEVHKYKIINRYCDKNDNIDIR